MTHGGNATIPPALNSPSPGNHSLGFGNPGAFGAARSPLGLNAAYAGDLPAAPGISSSQTHHARPPELPLKSSALSDIEKLRQLKETILNEQHPVYRPIPNPQALADLYLGPLPATLNGSQTTASQPVTQGEPSSGQANETRGTHADLQPTTTNVPGRHVQSPTGTRDARMTPQLPAAPTSVPLATRRPEPLPGRPEQPLGRVQLPTPPTTLPARHPPSNLHEPSDRLDRSRPQPLAPISTQSTSRPGPTPRSADLDTTPKTGASLVDRLQTPHTGSRYASDTYRDRDAPPPPRQYAHDPYADSHHRRLSVSSATAPRDRELPPRSSGRSPPYSPPGGPRRASSLERGLQPSPRRPSGYNDHPPRPNDTDHRTEYRSRYDRDDDRRPLPRDPDPPRHALPPRPAETNPSLPRRPEPTRDYDVKPPVSVSSFARPEPRRYDDYTPAERPRPPPAPAVPPPVDLRRPEPRHEPYHPTRPVSLPPRDRAPLPDARLPPRPEEPREQRPPYVPVPSRDAPTRAPPPREPLPRDLPDSRRPVPPRDHVPPYSDARRDNLTDPRGAKSYRDPVPLPAAARELGLPPARDPLPPPRDVLRRPDPPLQPIPPPRDPPPTQRERDMPPPPPVVRGPPSAVIPPRAASVDPRQHYRDPEPYRPPPPSREPLNYGSAEYDRRPPAASSSASDWRSSSAHSHRGDYDAMDWQPERPRVYSNAARDENRDREREREPVWDNKRPIEDIRRPQSTRQWERPRSPRLSGPAVPPATAPAASGPPRRALDARLTDPYPPPERFAPHRPRSLSPREDGHRVKRLRTDDDYDDRDRDRDRTRTYPPPPLPTWNSSAPRRPPSPYNGHARTYSTDTYDPAFPHHSPPRGRPRSPVYRDQ